MSTQYKDITIKYIEKGSSALNTQERAIIKEFNKAISKGVILDDKTSVTIWENIKREVITKKEPETVVFAEVNDIEKVSEQFSFLNPDKQNIYEYEKLIKDNVFEYTIKTITEKLFNLIADTCFKSAHGNEQWIVYYNKDIYIRTLSEAITYNTFVIGHTFRSFYSIVQIK